ncbi:hypothetical protein [Paenibacillus aquistagni]|uniref:hypothetical protein n=1 Tax=Paenibacillus aquistagni TaxID=1852522 RepID=UPI00145A7F05|nr:hypothetical protein [Paenibacillus aquistagni]NMM53679.1 hypothetical protein [Paenibacillus aquistagni]
MKSVLGANEGIGIYKGNEAVIYDEPKNPASTSAAILDASVRKKPVSLQEAGAAVYENALYSGVD